VPLITKLHIELHDVPRYDPFRLNADGTRVNYDFLQYFTDVDADSGDRQYTNPEYDWLDWIIDSENPTIVDPETGSTLPNLIPDWNNDHTV